MKNVVITGATGMIALALIRYFLKNEADTEIFCVTHSDSKKNTSIPRSPHVHLIKCDLDHYNQLSQLISLKCDAFFHFAWAGTFGDKRNDVFLQEKNIRYTLDAVSAAKALGCSCFIGAGSQAEYGCTHVDLSPDTHTDPITGYGIAKYAAGKLSRTLCNNLGLRHVWARILSIYGPHDGEKTMVTSCIRSFLKNESLPFTKGEQVWDYLYCDDAARALYLMAEKGVDGAIYPLGSGESKQLTEYIQTIRDIVAPTLKLTFGDLAYTKSQVMHLCADISSLTRDTGFIPEVTFEDGIKATKKWMESIES